MEETLKKKKKEKQDDLRAKLSQAISVLPPDCKREDVSKELDPILQSTPGINKNFETKVTPLMVCCDKGNCACLEYLLENFEEHADLIGRPSDVTDDKNTAMHHAAMSGCELSITILNQMGESFLSLASVRNSHGDTPLMMASINGHLNFLIAFQKLLAQDIRTESEIQSIFSAKNNSNDSCLSLACCHGMTSILDFLLSFVSVEPDILQICEPRLKKMDVAFQSNPSLMKQHKSRYDAVNQCVQKLQIKLAGKAEETARELLAEEESARPKAKSQTKKKKQLRKIKSQGKSNSAHGISPTSSSLSSTCLKSVEESENETMRLTTLADGTKAVIVEGETLERPRLPLHAPANSKEKSVDEMFRKRFEAASFEVDAVMNALCLDVSQLLFTPHQMALDLSPSQLDAVQLILEKQLFAVEEARNIQNRMHDTSKT